MLELKPNSNGTLRAESAFERQQPRRLMLALVLLLVALGGVLWHDRDFWFGTEQSIVEDGPEPAAATKTVAKSATPAHSPQSTVAKKQATPVQNQKKIAALPTPADAPTVSATRTVLPPLDVEVVAGDKHRTVHPGSNAAKVEITNPASAATQSSTLTAATDAAERERIGNDTQPAQSYPLLGQQMRVQGSVVLQALIGTDGVIQNLRVLSGPGILAAAAQQAVREWRFKPIVQNGQPVESQAKITVNFTIKIADGSSKTTLAESQPLTIETLIR
jgi:TonB family protein